MMRGREKEGGKGEEGVEEDTLDTLDQNPFVWCKTFVVVVAVPSSSLSGFGILLFFRPRHRTIFKSWQIASYLRKIGPKGPSHM